MHLTIVDDDADITGIRAGQRALFHTFHYTLQDSGHEACIDSTANYGVDEDQFAAPFQVFLFLRLDVHLEFLAIDGERGGVGHPLGIGLYNQVHLAELAGTARLLLVAIVGTCHLRDGLTIGNLRLDILDFNLLVVLHPPLQRTQVELALSVDNNLAQFLRLLNHPCGILLTHLGQGHHHLLGLGFVYGLDGARIL